jgi:hypothetical protein
MVVVLALAGEEIPPPSWFYTLSENQESMSHSDAARLYKDFQKLPVDKKIDGDIPQPTTLDALGPIRHIVYISQKWHEDEGRTGKGNQWMRYIHDFKKNPPLFCNDPKTKHYHIIGKCLVKPEGIMDWPRANAGNKGGKAAYDIPKSLTFLGYLQEIVYEAIEDGDDYKVEFSKNKALCANPSGLKLFIASLK